VIEPFTAHVSEADLDDLKCRLAASAPLPARRTEVMSENTWTVITGSLDLLRNVTAQIGNANCDAQTPCREWTVTQVLQHAAGDQMAWAASIGVGTGPSENPFAPSGHLKSSVDDLLEPALAAARNAWAGVRSDGAGSSGPTRTGFA
jgi:hypothetical protein